MNLIVMTHLVTLHIGIMKIVIDQEIGNIIAGGLDHIVHYFNYLVIMFYTLSQNRRYLFT